MRRARRADKTANGGVRAEVAQRHATTLRSASMNESELDRYRHLFDRAPVGYVMTDAEGRIERANLTCAEMLGRTPEELERRMFSQFVVPAERAGFASALARAVAQGGTHDWPVRLRVRGGEMDTTVTVTVHGRASLTPQTMYWAIRFDRRWQEADIL
jgi:PAS domain S-box-containing protein